VSILGHANPSVANRYRHQAEDAARLDEYLPVAVAGKIVTFTGAQSGAQRAQAS
jgi:hypothetical protein